MVVEYNSGGHSRGFLEHFEVIPDDIHIAFFEYARLILLRPFGKHFDFDFQRKFFSWLIG